MRFNGIILLNSRSFFASIYRFQGSVYDLGSMDHLGTNTVYSLNASYQSSQEGGKSGDLNGGRLCAPH